MSARTWELTLNNFTDADLKWLESLDISSGIVSKEVGESGTPHLQGRLSFKRTYRLAALKKLHGKVHWEPTKCKQDTNYYRKIDSEIVFEKVQEQGKRNDLNVVREMVKAKRKWHEIADECTSFQAVKCIKTLQEGYGQKRPDGPVTVYWCWGATGTGKSRWAHEQYPEAFEPISFKWWDGYSGETAAIIDDFRGDWCKYHELLRLLDRYPVKKEVKGGWVWLQVDTWIITSSYHPENVYKTDEDKGQLLRRITEIKHFCNNYDVLEGV